MIENNLNIESLQKNLRQLCLAGIADNCIRLAEQYEKEQKSHLGYLQELLFFEIEHRRHKRIARLLKAAKLPREKSLQSFEHSRIPGLSLSKIETLAQGDFLDRHENLLIFGNPGTGKTHLCLSLAQQWCLQGRKVHYTTTANLIQILLKAKDERKLPELIKKLDKFEALIIDDISYLPCDRSETDVLFTLLSERYEMRSTIVTSNLTFANWDQIFKDKMTTTAAIDRLVHHSIILELNAESYRIKTAKKKLQQQKEKEIKKE